MAWVPSEDSDQTGHLLRLTRVFHCTQWIAKDPSFLYGDCEDWSDRADVQADLRLRWAHMSFCWFCRALAQMIFTIAPDKSLFQSKIMGTVLISLWKCGYSLEVPHRDTSDEYHSIYFPGEIRKIYLGYHHLSEAIDRHRSLSGPINDCSLI